MTFNPVGQRFVGGHSPVSKQQILMIADYRWWCDHETDILTWMDNNLPYGRNQQTGMILTFDSDKDLLMFLLRWQA